LPIRAFLELLITTNMEDIWITILIAIITFALGYVSGIYLPNKFRKDDKKPIISISPFQEKHNYFDITNHSGDLLDLKIRISWLQAGKTEKREMNDFFNSTDDPVLSRSHKCNSLKKGESKKVAHCPMYSDNGKVEVSIEGKNIDDREYNKKITIRNLIRPK